MARHTFCSCVFFTFIPGCVWRTIKWFHLFHLSLVIFAFSVLVAVLQEHWSESVYSIFMYVSSSGFGDFNWILLFIVILFCCLDPVVCCSQLSTFSQPLWSLHPCLPLELSSIVLCGCLMNDLVHDCSCSQNACRCTKCAWTSPSRA